MHGTSCVSSIPSTVVVAQLVKHWTTDHRVVQVLGWTSS